MNYKEVQTIVKEYDKKLLATDPSFGYTVRLTHEEGTTFHFEYAFAVLFENWYVIFTEHHKFFIYDEDDISSITMHGPRITIDREDLRIK